MEREYIHGIEHVEKIFNNKTNTAVFGFKARQWKLVIVNISTGSYTYDIEVPVKNSRNTTIIGHVMCGTKTPFPPYIPDEFIIELFPTEDGSEIEHPNPDGHWHTKTPFQFRKYVASMYEVTRVIDMALNPLHWSNNPHATWQELLLGDSNDE